MIRVAAPSRLHFGLFSLGVEETWANVDGAAALPARCFGGVGLMVDEPGLAVLAEPAAGWSASGPMAGRALEYARRFAAALPGGHMSPQRLLIETAAPEHVGLGVGTQLALAVAKALAVAGGHADWDAVELARRVGRGLRSAIGIHGFQHGGLLVEGGKCGDTEIAPLLVRVAFPPEWRIVVAVPTDAAGLHGHAEQHAFALLRESTPVAVLDGLCRLVLLGMLPALAERDCRTFGEAVYDFNARVGEGFARVQGGRYANAFVADTIAFLRGQGVSGVGQSSWGPAVFAILEDEERGRRVLEQLRQRSPADAVDLHLTTASTCGARI